MPFAEVNGTRLHYESHGSGKPILLLHGFTLDRRMWRRQVEALGDRFRVIAYDARGFGRSALPDAPYKHCDDAAALCRHLETGPVIAVGHSIGGHQLLEMALTYPELVRGWVSVCTSGLASVPFPDDIQRVFAAVRQAAQADLATAKQIWMRCGWFTAARESPTLAQELDQFLADYSGWHWTHDNPYRNIEPPAAARLHELRAPALVITGTRDLPYNDAVAAGLCGGIAGAKRVQLDCGHMAPMEQPDALSRAIAELAA